MQSTDFLVLGSGLSSLVFALKAAEAGSVRIITKSDPMEGNSSHAQGGIAAALGEDDDPAKHAADTLECGCGLSDPRAVKLIIEAGPAAVKRLADLGVQFSEENGGYELGREGGHSRRRIAHAKDATGRAIMETLLGAIEGHPQIEVLAHHTAVDLIIDNKNDPDVSRRRCLGAYALDSQAKEIRPYGARVTFLASGGSGKVYRYTSNPDVATGDGVAMAYRAGCRVANLEFVQFHPTCLYHPDAKDFLISEATRGEGGYLTTLDGEPLEIPHPLRDLAPRDVVARSIDREMKRRGDRSVLLHLEQLDSEKTRRRFPTIYDTCLEYSIDITKQPIPVVPAAHYQCGGVVIDLDGRCDVPGLLAAGEVVWTGLHGANRLASNSLLEATVMGERAAATALQDLQSAPGVPELPPWDVGKATLPRETVLIDAHWNLVKTLMWEFVGIVRNDHRLGLAAKYLEIFRKSIESYYWDFVLDQDLIELRNIGLVADLIVCSARMRKESRGLHHNEDHPGRNDELYQRPTILAPPRTSTAAPTGAET